MDNGTEINLAKYRLEQAHECLKMAKIAMETSLKTSVNRSYYCIFHAMRAVLALEKFDSKKHSGVISAFRQRYIKTDIFPRHFSDIIGATFEIRNDSDYEDFYVVAESEAVQQLENAKIFLTAVEEYIENIINTMTDGSQGHVNSSKASPDSL